MRLLAKKIDIVHEIKFFVKKTKYVMNTNFDVCLGDICRVRIAGNIYDVEIITVTRLDHPAIIDPRIIGIYFDVDIEKMDSYKDESRYFYKVKLIDSNADDTYKIFTSDLKFKEKVLVVSNNHFGIIEEEIFDDNVISEDKVYQAYEVVFYEIFNIYDCAIVPRYLMHELIRKFKIKDEARIVNEEYRSGLFKQLIIDDDYKFEYDNTAALNYIVNNARFNDRKCIEILIELAERTDDLEQLEYWKSKIKDETELL